MPIAPIAIVLFKSKNAVYKSLVRAKPGSPKPIALTVRVELFALLKVHLTVLSANNAETSCLTVIKNDFEIVKMLIEAGADVNASNINGFTPIIEASKWASPEIVSYLLENGAEIGRRNITRSTGLHEIANIRRTFDMDDWTTSSMRDYALSDRRLQVFRRLLIAGADLMRKNNQNKTAVDLAESNQDAPLLKITEEVNKR